MIINAVLPQTAGEGFRVFLTAPPPAEDEGLTMLFSAACGFENTVVLLSSLWVTGRTFCYLPIPRTAFPFHMTRR